MLQAGVETLRGIGPTRAAQLQKQGVRTVEDLLHLFRANTGITAGKRRFPLCVTGRIAPCASA